MTLTPPDDHLPGSEPTNPVDALVQLSFLVQRILADAGAAHDLSIIQIRLAGILRDRTAGMLELGRHLALDKSSMTGLVSRAEKRGLVRRDPSPHDGRAVLVSLTPAGRALAAELTVEIGRRLTALTDRLPEASRTELVAMATLLLR